MYFFLFRFLFFGSLAHLKALNVSQVLKLLQPIQIIPPQLEAVMQYEGKPWSQGGAELCHRLVDLIAAEETHLAHLIAIGIQSHVLLQK